jgi:hypothetical protein
MEIGRLATENPPFLYLQRCFSNMEKGVSPIWKKDFFKSHA